MKNENSGRGKKVGGTVGVVAVIAAILAGLFGTGKLGFGDGFSFGNAPAETKQVITAAETPAETKPAEVAEAEEVIEIRVQEREYNYANITYGGAEHPVSELLEALADADRDAQIRLVVEDSATKNAVDDLKAALAGAGFTNVHTDD